MVKKLIVILFLLIAIQTVFAAQTIFWLRGNDISAPIEGSTFDFMSSTPPSSISTQTVIEKNVNNGSGELTRWYSSVFPVNFVLSGTIFFWASDFELKSGNAQYRLVLYEFNPEEQNSTLISEFAWTDFEGQIQQSQKQLIAPYIINARNRLKLVLEYKSVSDSSVIRLVLDESLQFGEIIWSAPNELTFSAIGVQNTAAILLETCGVSAITCSNDFDCEDFQQLTSDTCINPGACNSYCDFLECETQCVSNNECVDENPLTKDVCSGIGECNTTCSNELCDINCNSDSQCNDQDTSTLDECIYPGTCLAFCRVTPCEGTACLTDDINICGNNICEFGEVCAADCSEDRYIELIDVTPGEYFLYGDTILVKAKVSGFVITPKVTMNGFFGEIELLDNGLGLDEKVNDEIYTSEFKVEPPVSPLSAITISATDEINTVELVKYYVIAPLLEIGLKTNKQNYYSTDKLVITVFANKKGESLQSDLFLTVINSLDQKIADQSISQNQYGLYTFTYQFSSFDPKGEIEIIARISDEQQNSAIKKSTVFLSESELVQRGLVIEILELPGQISKKELQKIEVIVKDISGNLVENAQVKLILYNNSVVEMQETSPGSYSGFFELEVSDFSNEQSITIEAVKTVDGKKIEATLIEKIFVKPLSIDLEVKGLNKDRFSYGEVIKIEISGKINGKKTPLKEVEVFVGGKRISGRKLPETFVVDIFLDESLISPAEITINAIDVYNNTGSFTTNIPIIGFYFQYYLGKNPGTFFVLILLLIGAVLGAVLVFRKKHEHERLKKRESEIIKEIKNLQNKYFKEGFLSRKDYDSQIIKLEGEMKSVRKKLKK